MRKAVKTGPSAPFDRFQQLIKALLAVPREELQKKLDKYNRKKAKRKAG